MTTPELNKALAAFQANLPAIAKGETGKVEGKTKDGRPFSYTYQYADLAAVADAVLPALGKHGLAFTAWPMTNPDGNLALAYSLTHESGEERAGEFPLYLILPERVTPQQLGGFLTYIRRYVLCSVTGVAPGGEDDDAQAAEQAATALAPAARRPRQQRPTDAAPAAGGSTHARGPNAAATPARRPAPPSPDGPLSAGTGSVTPAQLKKLGATFTGMGFTSAERDQRIVAAAQIVGRELSSSADLSRHEASKLIDTLERCRTRSRLLELLATGEMPADEDDAAGPGEPGA